MEPLWLKAARDKLGLREAPGSLNNPTILGWAKRLGVKVLGIAYNADSTPWCGVFVAECMVEAGIPTPPIAVRASSWESWGRAVGSQLALGVVLVFRRPGGGHVGLYVGEGLHLIDGEMVSVFYVLGGNQGDRVSVVPIEKSRCVAMRWPVGIPFSAAPVKLAGSGQPVSHNEA